jgi:hypothetical protein
VRAGRPEDDAVVILVLKSVAGVILSREVALLHGRVLLPVPINVRVHTPPRFFFSADFYEISPETGNLATHRDMLIPVKKIRYNLNLKMKERDKYF